MKLENIFQKLIVHQIKPAYNITPKAPQHAGLFGSLIFGEGNGEVGGFAGVHYNVEQFIGVTILAGFHLVHAGLQLAKSAHHIANTPHQLAESTHHIADSPHQSAESAHYSADSQHQSAESEHYIADS